MCVVWRQSSADDAQFKHMIRGIAADTCQQKIKKKIKTDRVLLFASHIIMG